MKYLIACVMFLVFSLSSFAQAEDASEVQALKDKVKTLEAKLQYYAEKELLRIEEEMKKPGSLSFDELLYQKALVFVDLDQLPMAEDACRNAIRFAKVYDRNKSNELSLQHFLFRQRTILLGKILLLQKKYKELLEEMETAKQSAKGTGMEAKDFPKEWNEFRDIALKEQKKK